VSITTFPLFKRLTDGYKVAHLPQRFAVNPQSILHLVQDLLGTCRCPKQWTDRSKPTFWQMSPFPTRFPCLLHQPQLNGKLSRTTRNIGTKFSRKLSTRFTMGLRRDPTLAIDDNHVMIVATTMIVVLIRYGADVIGNGTLRPTKSRTSAQCFVHLALG
jgi:hypothetical protein